MHRINIRGSARWGRHGIPAPPSPRHHRPPARATRVTSASARAVRGRSCRYLGVRIARVASCPSIDTTPPSTRAVPLRAAPRRQPRLHRPGRCSRGRLPTHHAPCRCADSRASRVRESFPLAGAETAIDTQLRVFSCRSEDGSNETNNPNDKYHADEVRAACREYFLNSKVSP